MFRLLSAHHDIECLQGDIVVFPNKRKLSLHKEITRFPKEKNVIARNTYMPTWPLPRHVETPKSMVRKPSIRHSKTKFKIVSLQIDWGRNAVSESTVEEVTLKKENGGQHPSNNTAFLHVVW